MTSSLRPDDFDALHDFIRVQVAAGYAAPEEIAADAAEHFSQSSSDPQGLGAAVRAITEQAMARHLAEQVGWPDETDCDRLDAAFAELEASGIVARQHFSCCGTCGVQDVKEVVEQARKSGRLVRGYTFFHVQDTEQAVAGEALYLSYGSADGDREASLAIGHEVVEVLRRHGLQPAWNGKPAYRIALPLTWQRRRRPGGWPESGPPAPAAAE